MVESTPVTLLSDYWALAFGSGDTDGVLNGLGRWQCPSGSVGSASDATGNSEVAGCMNLRSAYLLFPAPSIYDTAVCQLTVTKARDALPPVGTESDNG